MTGITLRDWHLLSYLTYQLLSCMFTIYLKTVGLRWLIRYIFCLPFLRFWCHSFMLNSKDQMDENPWSRDQSVQVSSFRILLLPLVLLNMHFFSSVVHHIQAYKGTIRRLPVDQRYIQMRSSGQSRTRELRLRWWRIKEIQNVWTRRRHPSICSDPNWHRRG